MSQILNQEDGKVVISFSASKEEFAKGLDSAFKRAVKRVNAPGFRKGKLPRAVFNKMYGEEALYQDAVDAVLPAAYTKAIDELKVSPLAMPDIDVKEISKENGVSFEAVVTVKPNVELGEYKHLGIKKEEVEVTDADVEERLERLLSNQAEWQIKEGEAKKGDIVVIDFKGFIGDEAFEGGEAKGYELELGSGSFIPGFEDQLEGKVAPVDTEVNVTFPENYQVADLAGKEAKFEVTIHDVKEKVLPELTDEFVKEFSKEAASTVAEYKEKLRGEIKVQKEEAAAKAYSDKVISTAVENAKLTVPTKLIDQEVNSMFEQFAGNLSRQGLSFELYEQFTGKGADELKAEMRSDAENKIKTSFVLGEIAEVEKVEVTDADIDAEVKELATMYNMTEEGVRTRISVEDLRGELIIQKTVEFLKENN
ncbi:Trigger factor [Gemella morbillorum]|uniref:trigger factor n=1 Tax=Gemella morbillorum TaxID=29391 RepID=UPI000DA2C5C6|nr:trigger factor [Gemella morbillorum]MBF1209965.1 trigger factor [Gemella morbillorum]MDK8239549.1 trigger factor [Gemella morbillorum]MDK8254767.1 trigger factor [Gemella morbillorum]UBH81062.1 trigger factor [Gemella morbillorum]SQH54822.1 Trigger factor [Gemella morbillorum]